MPSFVSRKHTQRSLRFCWVISLLFCTARAFAAQSDGFVTQVNSSKEFDMGSLHVGIDGKTHCETERLRSNIQVKTKTFDVILAQQSFLLQNHRIAASKEAVPCKGLAVKIGSRVQIAGDARQGDGVFVASRLTLYLVTIKQNFENDWSNREWQGGALLEETPQVARTAKGWSGNFWLDGYPMTIMPGATLLAAPAGTELRYRQFGLFGGPRKGTNLLREILPAFSATLFRPNTWATYRGAGVIDGRVLLDRIRMWPNQIGTEEREYWAQVNPIIRAPDYASHIPGSVTFAHARPDKTVGIVPDRSVQEFVTMVGTSVIPQYQKDLPEQDGTKVHFRFYVVRPAGTALNSEMSKIDGSSDLLRPSWDEAAVGFPNGAILVPDSTLVRIENEAQLASILSDAVTWVLQKQSYITHYAHADYMFASAPDFSQLAFVLSMSEETLRIGIRQMYLAGYDIREAPVAHAAAEGKPLPNPRMDAKDPDIPWYGAYDFDYLSRYYSDVDFGKLKRGREKYSLFLDELRRADPEAFTGTRPERKP